MILCGGVVAQRHAFHRHRAGARGQQPGDDAQQRGLAGAVRADHRDRLAGVHRHRRRRTAPGSRRSPHRCWTSSSIRRSAPEIHLDHARVAPAPPSAARRRSPRHGRAPRTRSTTRISTPMMCSTHTMVMPFSRRMRSQHVGGLLHLGVVEPVEAFVRQQQARLRRERARELELLQRGGAKPVGRACARRSAGRPGRAPPRQAAMQSARVLPRSWPKNAESATFSSSVRLRNGRGIWNVRAMPLWQMRLGGSPAMSAPSKRIDAGARRVRARRCS